MYDDSNDNDDDYDNGHDDDKHDSSNRNDNINNNNNNNKVGVTYIHCIWRFIFENFQKVFRNCWSILITLIQHEITGHL